MSKVETSFRSAFKEIEARIGRSLSGFQKDELIELVESAPVLMEDTAEATEDAALATEALLQQLRVWGDIFPRTNGRGLIEDKHAGDKGKWFERRVYLVDFVLERTCTPREIFVSLANKTPIPLGRFKWKKLILEWNELHPSDKLRNANVLKMAFFKALKDEAVMQEILARELREIQSLAQIAKQAHDDLREYSSRSPITVWLYNTLVAKGGKPK